jgi:hypothetical protein
MREELRWRLHGNMRVMQSRRAVALVALALASAACSTGVAVAPTTSGITVTTSTVPTMGEVCGVTAMAGGPAGGVGVKDPALLHVCPTGPFQVTDHFSILGSNGKRYKAYSDRDGWLARLPAGTYRVDGANGCGAEPPFVVPAGKTHKGVVAWFSCGIV